MKTSQSTKKYLVNFKGVGAGKKTHTFYDLAKLRVGKKPKNKKEISHASSEVDKIVYGL
jgi:hypothetical protein